MSKITLEELMRLNPDYSSLNYDEIELMVGSMDRYEVDRICGNELKNIGEWYLLCRLDKNEIIKIIKDYYYYQEWISEKIGKTLDEVLSREELEDFYDNNN